MDNSNWMLEEFCKRVNELKSHGVAEDDAKKIIKTIMDGACDIITNERTIADIIRSIPNPEDAADTVNNGFFKPINSKGV